VGRWGEFVDLETLELANSLKRDMDVINIKINNLKDMLKALDGKSGVSPLISVQKLGYSPDTYRLSSDMATVYLERELAIIEVNLAGLEQELHGL